MASQLPLQRELPIMEITRETAEHYHIREVIIPDDSTIILDEDYYGREHIFIQLADCTTKYYKCWQRSVGNGTVIISILDASKKSEKIYKCDTKQITIYWCQLCMDYERQFL